MCNKIIQSHISDLTFYGVIWGQKNIIIKLSYITHLLIKHPWQPLATFQQQLLTVSEQRSHLPPAERGNGHTRVLRVLDMTVLRGLSQCVQEVDSSKVSVSDFEHILGQRPGTAFIQCDV